MYIICATKHCFTEQRIYTFSLGVWCIKASSAPMNIVMITCHADTTSYKRLPYHWLFVWGIHRESTFLFTCMSSYNRKKQNETSKQKKVTKSFWWLSFHAVAESWEWKCPCVGRCKSVTHDDVMTWIRFPHYWPYVRRIHHFLFLLQWVINAILCCFGMSLKKLFKFIFKSKAVYCHDTWINTWGRSCIRLLYKIELQLHKQSSCRWFETPRHSCDFTF